MPCKIVNKGHLDYCFLRIRLDLDGTSDGPLMTSVEFKQTILAAVKSLFGTVGASTCMDVLQYEPTTRTAIIRIYNKFLVKFWSALTLYSPHAFRVLQVSPHLPALSQNSRTMVIETVP